MRLASNQMVNCLKGCDFLFFLFFFFDWKPPQQPHPPEPYPPIASANNRAHLSQRQRAIEQQSNPFWSINPRTLSTNIQYSPRSLSSISLIRAYRISLRLRKNSIQLRLRSTSIRCTMLICARELKRSSSVISWRWKASCWMADC